MISGLLKTFFLTFVIGSTVLNPVRGQTETPGSLEGKVVDGETKLPVTGALISLESITKGQPEQQQRIGPTGAFRFALLAGKGYYIQTEYYIRTEAAGYLPTKEKFTVSSGYTTRLSGKTIYLKKGVAPKSPPEPSRTTTPPTAATVTDVKPPVSATESAGTGTGSPVATTAQSAPVSATSALARSSTPLVPRPAAPITSTSTSASVSGTPASTPGTVLPAKPVISPPVTAKSVQTELRALQFVQSKAELTPGSQPALDQLLTFMRENQSVSIELAGHTDNQGNFDENLTLSRQRVELVKSLLVKNGISASRIVSRGYGSTRPVASNNSEETRRLNRRVEMIILTK